MSGPLDAERKFVTVLFADLVGHTEAAVRLGAEQWHALLQAYFAEVSRPIERYGGTLEKFIGDAVFAVFGVPRAHEDDAERAVRAAIEMQAALIRLNVGMERRVGVPLAMRIGIATGEAVASRELRERDHLIVGELTSLAERLQREAPPNGVVLSERTRALLGSLVDADSLGELDLKGFRETQRAYLLRRLRADDAMVGLVGASTPLVNRERELAELLELRELILAGHGQIVFVSGEAGHGKSRLISEFRATLGEEVRVLTARCYEFAQTTPYGVVVEHLRGYLGLASDDPPEAGRLQLGAALHAAFATSAPEIRLPLEDLLGLDTTKKFKELVGDLATDEIREQVLQAVSLFWERSAGAPLVLLVEDLHWIDAASAAAFGHLFEVTERAPITLLCALRPERHSLGWELKTSAERDYSHRYREVRLGPLSNADAERLAGALLNVLALPVNLKTMVADRAEGNPFYVEAVVRSLQQHGPDPAVMQRLPDTLQGLLQARIDALLPGARRVLQIAAVVGRIFPLRLVKTISGANGDLAGHITALQRADFVSERRRIPEPTFAFRHVLLQEAAYHTLLGEERREMHRRLADALELETRADPDLPALFHHYVRGEVWPKAVAFGERAATWAGELGAHDEALSDFRSVVEILGTHADAAPPEIHRRVHEKYGDLLVLCNRFDEARNQYQALTTLASLASQQAYAERKVANSYRREGKLDRAVQHLQQALQILPAGADPTEEAWAHLDLGYLEDLTGGDPRSVLAHCEQARTLAAGRDMVLNARVYRLFTIAYVHLGDMERAMETALQAVEYASQGRDDLETAIAYNNLADVHRHRGDIEIALAHVQQGLAVAARLERRKGAVHIATLLMTRGELHLARGEWERAEEALGEGLRHLQEVGPAPRIQLETLSHLAESLIEQDRPEEAVHLLDQARQLCETFPLFRFVPMLLRIRAEAYLRAQDFERAQESSGQAMEAAEQYGSEGERPALLRVRARVAAEQREYGEALELLRKAAELFGQRGQVSELGRVLLEKAKIHLILQEKTPARDILEQAKEHFGQLGARVFLEQVDRLFDVMK